MTFSKESGQKVWFTFYAFSIYSILPFFFRKIFLYYKFYHSFLTFRFWLAVHRDTHFKALNSQIVYPVFKKIHTLFSDTPPPPHVLLSNILLKAFR